MSFFNLERLLLFLFDLLCRIVTLVSSFMVGVGLGLSFGLGLGFIEQPMLISKSFFMVKVFLW
jgi:hypothetical protein